MHLNRERLAPRSGVSFESAGRTGTPIGGAAGLLARLTRSGISGALLVAGPAWGQSAPEERILVIGERIAPAGLPERTLRDDDVASYGLATIGELLAEIAEEDGTFAGDSVILVDGQLVRGLAAIEAFPVEAIDRIEVLPRGAAGPLGASTSKRAYNVVLRPKVRVLAARAAVRAATDGGWSETSGDIGFTAVDKPRRINLSLRGRDSGALRESERDVEQPPDAPAGLARFRTLLPSRDRLDANLVIADRLAPWLRGSLTLKLARSGSRSGSGLSPSLARLGQQTRSSTGSADLQLEGEWGDWLVTLAGTYRAQDRRTMTDLESGGRQRGRSISRARSLELTANGPLLALPAGSLRLTAGVNWSRDTLDASVDGLASGGVQTNRAVRGAIDVPIASRSTGFLAPLGELAFGAEVQRSHVSAFGNLSTDTLTIRWQPADWLRLFASSTNSASPASVGLMAEPPIETPGVRYFDPARNETTDVTAVTGGIAGLPESRTRERRLSIQMKPVRVIDLAISADYSRSINRNIIAALPPASDSIFAAFPERFVRDSNGTLVRVDLRPVSFARHDEQQLRTGINLALPLAVPGQGATSGSRKARIQLSASHSLVLKSKLLIRPGLEPIDLLAKDAVGLGGGSRPRHQFDLSFGYAEPGLGARVTINRRGGSFLDAAGDQGANLLRFRPLTTLGLRAFAEGSRLLPGVDWLQGARFSLTVVNLANAREKVRDASGLTPLGYQPAYRDPLGRTIELELRKTF